MCFLKLIESSQTKIGLDYLCVKFLNWGIKNVYVPAVTPLWRGTLDAKHLDTNPACTAGKLLWQNCCSWRGLNKPNSSLAVLHRWRFCLLKGVFFNMQVFITVPLILLWLHSEKKKKSYLTLYFTGKLLLVVVSSAMFIFHQMMFVSNVCKS